ncbi:acyltransferase [Flavobacterium sp.]|uniref:acyltransferase n=1 Tax=Flavobacterium sp. TaxID=239 RepID=UPI002C621601|nr:acyltransferase [Flavobacterium sp.]HSD06485.1 acyltransferase [Flavobacterium sp.]
MVKSQRDSNIELLRVISMVMIVFYHFMARLSELNSPEKTQTIVNSLIPVVHIGVICFVLISGYWGIKFSIKGFLRLFLYCSFYSIAIYTISAIINPDLFSLKNFIKSIIPYQWWFIPVYLCLYLLSPLINIPLKTESAKTKLFFIIILLVISFVVGHFVPSLSDGKNPLNFVLIYYLGNFLRTEVKLPSWNVKKLFYLYLICNVLLFVAIFFSTLYIPKIAHIIIQFFYPYNSAGIMINSILFFLIFTKLKFNSRVINWLSSSSLAVYLLHENNYIIPYLSSCIDQLQNSTTNSVVFISILFVFAIIIFIVAVLIDKVISPLFDILFNFVINSKLFAKLNNKVQDVLPE